MSTNEYLLAELLLRRKELNGKVATLNVIKEKDIFEVKVERVKVTDSIDNLTAKVPKLTAGQVTAEYDYYARQLRLVDAVIQQTNWTTKAGTSEDVMKDYTKA